MNMISKMKATEYGWAYISDGQLQPGEGLLLTGRALLNVLSEPPSTLCYHATLFTDEDLDVIALKMSRSLADLHVL